MKRFRRKNRRRDSGSKAFPPVCIEDERRNRSTTMKAHGEEGRRTSSVGRRSVRAMTMNIPISSSLLGWRGFRWLALVALSTMQKGENRRRSTRCSVVFPANCLIAFNGCSMWKVTCDWLLACTKRWRATSALWNYYSYTKETLYVLCAYLSYVCIYIYVCTRSSDVCKNFIEILSFENFAVSWKLRNQYYFHQRSWKFNDCCLNYKKDKENFSSSYQ